MAEVKHISIDTRDEEALEIIDLQAKLCFNCYSDALVTCPSAPA